MTLTLFTPRLPRPARPLLAALVTGTCLTAPAFALTPDELWEQNLGYLRASGYEVSADISRAGDDLTVDTLRLTMTTEVEDDEDVTMVLTLHDLTYAARGDEVELVLPAAMAMTMEGDSDEGPFSAQMTLTQQALRQIFGGTPEDLTATYEADQIGLTVDQVTGPDDVTLTDLLALTLDAVTGSARMTSGDLYNVEQSILAETLSYRFDVVAPAESGEEGEAHATGELTGLTMQSTAALPARTEGEEVDPAKLFANGLSVDTQMLHQGGKMELQGSSDGDSFSMSHTSTGGQFQMQLSEQGVHYDASATDLAVQVVTDQLPFPVDVTLAETGFGLTMPLTAGDEPEPIGLRITLREADLPEGLWGMVDPTGALPHDPITLDARLSGAARLFQDLTDPEAMQEMGPGETPGELTALTLDMLELKAGGAAVQAEGHFDIDNSVPSKLNPDMPKATGSLEVTAQGLLKLVETLGQMGLIPPQQAMSVPMMAGMFARQVSGPDDLATTIEITDEQSLLVNGTPMMP